MANVQVTRVVASSYEAFNTGLELGKQGFYYPLIVSPIEGDAARTQYVMATLPVQDWITDELWEALEILIADDGRDHPSIDWGNLTITDPSSGLTIEYIIQT